MSGRNKSRSLRPPSAMAGRSTSTRIAPSSRTVSATAALIGKFSSSDSISSSSVSRSKSPNNHVAGVKRKEREFDEDATLTTNINVVVRCRGRNDREVRENSAVVVGTDGTVGKSIDLSMGPNALSNKTYTFDRVFSPAANQAMVFEEVVAPILDQMLHGFNCTVFAYGQTGTGKTYTMSGDMSDSLGLMSDSAGIIPRVLMSLFKTLDAEEPRESTVKCSFIELYNEELRDLITLDETAKLKIFDQEKKGHITTVVQGMEESHIKNADEGIRLLQTGSHRRQVAATKCNDLSSRSHTVFTITVFAKIASGSGEEEVCTGKLNLVDLAGSENIQRSGAENKRATEAGLINRSLLTLGRVINALVDRSAHIPYRESKLTRLLQDSLGGRTKTCIIATVSPSKSNLEETMSTLDYAFRAKNIKNKPQVNQLVPKHTMLREFTAEIQQLKGELIMTRQRNGVYLSNEVYEEMTTQNESRRILSEEQRAKLEIMEASLRDKTQELIDLTSDLSGAKKDTEAVRKALNDAKNILENTKEMLSDTRKNLENESLLREAHQATEKQLATKGEQLINTLSRTVRDVDGLHDKVRRKADLHSANRANWHSSQKEVEAVTKLVEARVENFHNTQQDLIRRMADRVRMFVAEQVKSIDTHKSAIVSAGIQLSNFEKDLTVQASDARHAMNNVLEEIKVLREDVKNKVGEGLQGLSTAAGMISTAVIGELDEFHRQLHSSYSVLGEDMKNAFELFDAQVIAQKNEALRLREEYASATTAAAKRNQTLEAKFQASLQRERSQATMARNELLTQIAALINTSGTEQEQRWDKQMRSFEADSKIAHGVSIKEFEECQIWLDAWVAKEANLQSEMAISGANLRSKTRADWMMADEKYKSIASATKSVHEETVRIVDEQMQDMNRQMISLDDSVSHARIQNETHHSAHLASLQKLGTTVSSAFATATAALNGHNSEMGAFKSAAEEQTAALVMALPTFDASTRQPLEQLRENIMGTPVIEYLVTGETPAKIQYAFPRNLPRTASHEILIARGRPLTIEQPSLEPMPASAPASPNKNESQRKSPSKGHIYSESDGLTLSPLSVSPRKASDDNTLSLREMDANIVAAAPALAAIVSDKRGNDVLDSEKFTIGKRRKGATGATKLNYDGSIVPVALELTNTLGNSMGPPLFKKLDREGARARGSKKIAEGRENIPMEQSGSRASRRLRSTTRS